MKELPYNPESKESIYEYALNLKEKSFKDVLNNDPNIDNETKALLYVYFNNPKGKGSLGQLIEEHFFFYNSNNNPNADFNEAGVELKVTPYLIKTNGDLRAKERLVLSMIDYMEDYKVDDFLKSHVYKKCALMLLIHYLYEPSKERLDYLIKFN